MKTFISITIVCLIMFSLSVCKSPAIQQHKTLEKIMADGIVHSPGDKNSGLEYFTVSIDTNDSVRFKEDGNVYVSLTMDHEIFEITKLHQQHRLCSFKKLMLPAR